MESSNIFYSVIDAFIKKYIYFVCIQIGKFVCHNFTQVFPSEKCSLLQTYVLWK